MRLDDDTHAAHSRVGQQLGQRDLGAGVQVALRVLQVDQLPRYCRQQRHERRKHLRHANAHVGDID